ncbi:hypothetical protein JCM10908_003924 [Rhodotorula pacifica]|uniref:uncharacterized protein n=1 Tax=Rhodotorula pacifica TaxID=1495444 RepID=UPI00316D6A21
MSALASTLRQAAVASTRRTTRLAQPIARRQMSGATSPHHWEPPHYTLKERLQKFAPVEIAPLVLAVATVSTFAIANIYWAFQRPEGELRLVPSRLNRKQQLQPWEDERALQGKW